MLGHRGWDQNSSTARLRTLAFHLLLRRLIWRRIWVQIPAMLDEILLPKVSSSSDTVASLDVTRKGTLIVLLT
jgi:hypothetical protein